MAVRVRLAVIPSADEALHDLGTIPFFALHLFSAGGRHSSTVTELFRLIERLEELHTEVQGMISSPHLSTTLLFGVSRRWSQYLNRCVEALAFEVVEAPGGSVSFSLEPTLVNMEGGGLHWTNPPSLTGRPCRSRAASRRECPQERRR